MAATTPSLALTTSGLRRALPGAGCHVLVTGGAGFIGGHLVDRLLVEGCRVTVVDNFNPVLEPAKQRVVTGQVENARYRLVSVDVRDLAGLSAALRDDYAAVVHLAAPGPSAQSLDAGDARQVIVMGTLNLLHFARQRGIRHFVHASTAAVYGLNGNLPWQEDFALHPRTGPAIAAYSAERCGRTRGERLGLRFIALRLFSVYGPRQGRNGAVHLFSRCLRAGRGLPVYGDGSLVRDYVYIDDAVEALVAALRYEGPAFEVFNVCSGVSTPVRELVRLLAREFGAEARLESRPVPASELPAMIGCVRKARAHLGYAPAVDLATGLAAFRRWLEGQPPEDSYPPGTAKA